MSQSRKESKSGQDSQNKVEVKERHTILGFQGCRRQSNRGFENELYSYVCIAVKIGVDLSEFHY